MTLYIHVLNSLFELHLEVQLLFLPLSHDNLFKVPISIILPIQPHSDFCILISLLVSNLPLEFLLCLLKAQLCVHTLLYLHFHNKFANFSFDVFNFTIFNFAIFGSALCLLQFVRRLQLVWPHLTNYHQSKQPHSLVEVHVVDVSREFVVSPAWISNDEFPLLFIHSYQRLRVPLGQHKFTALIQSPSAESNYLIPGQIFFNGRPELLFPSGILALFFLHALFFGGSPS